jgi:hypothetical protein
MFAAIALCGLALVAIGIISATVDRAARAEAWRQIAIERRWNHERLSLRHGELTNVQVIDSEATNS